MTLRPAKTQISLGIHPVWSVFIVRMKKAWALSYPMSAQRRLWSDWADAQADPSLCWAQSLCWFCHEAAHMSIYLAKYWCPRQLLYLLESLTRHRAKEGGKYTKSSKLILFQKLIFVYCSIFSAISKPEDQWSCKRSPDTWSWYIF